MDEEKIANFKQRVFKSNQTNKNFSGCYLVLELASGMLVGVVSGYYLDKYLNSLPVFLFLGSILGIISGGYNTYKALVEDNKAKQ